MTEADNSNDVLDPQESQVAEPTAPPAEPTDPPADPQAPAQEPSEPEPPEDPDERILHKLRSWQGRRDAELIQKIKQEVASVIPRPLPTPQTPLEPTADPFTQPKEWFRQMREIEESERAQKTYVFNQTLVSAIQNTLAQDQSLLDPANEDLRNEVMEEIRKASVDMSMDPRFAGALVVNNARATVYARRLSQPKNPLSGNRKLAVPVGGTQPTATDPTPAKSKVKLDEHAARLAQKLKLSEEKVAKILEK